MKGLQKLQKDFLCVNNSNSCQWNDYINDYVSLYCIKNVGRTCRETLYLWQIRKIEKCWQVCIMFSTEFTSVQLQSIFLKCVLNHLLLFWSLKETFRNNRVRYKKFHSTFFTYLKWIVQITNKILIQFNKMYFKIQLKTVVFFSTKIVWIETCKNM